MSGHGAEDGRGQTQSSEPQIGSHDSFGWQRLSAHEVVVTTDSVEQTISLGTLLGKHAQPGLLITLIGDLGAGKTHLVKGLAKGLAVDEHVVVASPTFVLVHEYPGRLTIYHFDLYRLPEYTDLAQLGFDEYWFGQGVSAVEWADRFAHTIPDDHLRIEMEQPSSTSRRIKLSARGETAQQVLKQSFPSE